MDLIKNITAIMADPEKRARFFAELKAREEARVAAMTPAERARYEEKRKREEEYEQYLGERSTLTNGEIIQERDGLEQALDMISAERDEARTVASHTRKSLYHATSSQGGTDRTLTEALARIKDLEAKLKATEAERDAARRAYLDLLDMIAKADTIPQPSNKRRK